MRIAGRLGKMIRRCTLANDLNDYDRFDDETLREVTNSRRLEDSREGEREKEKKLIFDSRSSFPKMSG